LFWSMVGSASGDAERAKMPALPTIDQIKPVGPTDFLQMPVADVCSRDIQCAFEDKLGIPDVNPRWMESDDATDMFLILRNAISFDQVLSNGLILDESLAEEGIDVFIHVYADRQAAASMRGQCTLLCFPRSVTLEVTYYQITKEVKRILAATLIYDEFDRDTSDRAYTLTIDYYPLNYLDLVIAFAFPTGFFIILFLVIGVLTVFVFFSFWLVNRGLAIYRHGFNPPFKLIGYLSLIVPPIFAGMLVPTIPMAIVTFGIFILFNGWQYVYGLTWGGENWIFDIIYNEYVMVKVDPTLVGSTRNGRIGVCFLIFGIYMMVMGAMILVPGKFPEESATSTGSATSEKSRGTSGRRPCGGGCTSS
jgi:hypothetical protein